MWLLLSVPSEYSQLVDVKGKTNHLAICDTSDYVLWQQTRIKVFFFSTHKSFFCGCSKKKAIYTKEKESPRLGHWSGRKSRSAGSRAATAGKIAAVFRFTADKGTVELPWSLHGLRGDIHRQRLLHQFFQSEREIKRGTAPPFFACFGGSLLVTLLLN